MQSQGYFRLLRPPLPLKIRIRPFSRAGTFRASARPCNVLCGGLGAAYLSAQTCGVKIPTGPCRSRMRRQGHVRCIVICISGRTWPRFIIRVRCRSWLRRNARYWLFRKAFSADLGHFRASDNYVLVLSYPTSTYIELLSSIPCVDDGDPKTHAIHGSYTLASLSNLSEGFALAAAVATEAYTAQEVTGFDSWWLIF